MRRTARAIIVKENNILLMYRDKFGNEYYTLPGGEVEIGEEILQTLYREIHEETSLEIDNAQLMFIEHAGNMYGDQFIFLCEYISGVPQLRSDSEEVMLEKISHNIHKPVWIGISEFKNLRFLSQELKEKVIIGLENGWPAEVQEFTSTRNV